MSRVAPTWDNKSVPSIASSSTSATARLVKISWLPSLDNVSPVPWVLLLLPSARKMSVFSFLRGDLWLCESLPYTLLLYPVSIKQFSLWSSINPFTYKPREISEETVMPWGGCWTFPRAAGKTCLSFPGNWLTTGYNLLSNWQSLWKCPFSLAIPAL